MTDFYKALNEIMDYIDEIKTENQKQNRILSILKPLIEIIPNNTTDADSIYDIRIKPLHIIDDKFLLEIKEWLENEL
ncbi:MAG: hypothetical protein J6T10_07305 [Methanobrevibacter sp.]|nr:hypothetical protein [Methanobrevibacter sp.]